MSKRSNTILLAAIMLVICCCEYEAHGQTSRRSQFAPTNSSAKTSQDNASKTRSLPEPGDMNLSHRIGRGSGVEVESNFLNSTPPIPNDDELNRSEVGSDIAEYGLSLSDLEILALQYNPSIAAMLDEVQGLRNTAFQAGLYPNPTVGYVGNEIGNDNTLGQHGAFIGRTHVRGGKIELSKQVALTEVDVRIQQLRQQELRVLTDLRLAYVSYLIAERRVERVRNLVSVNGNLLETTQKLIDAEEAKRSDLLLVEIELAKSRTMLTQEQTRLDSAHFQLAAICGQTDLNLAKTSSQILDETEPVEFESTLSQLLGGSPEVVAAESSVRNAEAKIRREYAETVSNIDTQISVQHDQSSDNVFANFQVSFPLQVCNRNQGNISAAKADWSAANHRVNQVRLRLTNQFSKEFQNYQMAQIEYQQYEKEILPRAKQSIDLVGKGYKAGEISFADFITVQRTYIQASMQQLDALEKLWYSRTRMEGLLLFGSID